MISKYTLREQIEEAREEWDDDIAPAERGDKVMIAFCKTVRVPISEDCAVLDTYEDPTAPVRADQPINAVMAGRRRWQDDIDSIMRAVIAAEELERERKEREMDDYRREFATDYLNAARDRVIVGPGMSGDRAWHRED